MIIFDQSECIITLKLVYDIGSSSWLAFLKQFCWDDEVVEKLLTDLYFDNLFVLPWLDDFAEDRWKYEYEKMMKSSNKQKIWISSNSGSSGILIVTVLSI